MDYNLLTIILMLILSAFFSGMEIAYVSSNKVHIAIEKNQKSLLGSVLQKITKRPSKFIATMLVGNNIALVIYGFYMGELLIQFIHLEGFVSLLVQTIISTIVILITAEFLPKVFFQIYANQLVKLFAIPAYFFYIIFSIISEFVIWVSDRLLKLIFKTNGDTVQLSFSKVELGNYIIEQMESVEVKGDVDSEIHIFQKALDFSDVRSREVMIPRTEVVGINIDTAPKELRALFTDTGLSKILVYNDNLDDILGYVHSFELFKKPKTIKEVLIPVVFVPETILIKDVLNILTRKRKSIAVVIDEYGGTSGILTVEDIIEELFGEIEDEHDQIELTETVVDDNTFIFSARIEVDYINETYDLNLPESENFETLGGMIVNFTEEIPSKDDSIIIDGYTINIIEVSNTKIELIELKNSSEN
jgi:CBS domain containing-hemolysin-like protein